VNLVSCFNDVDDPSWNLTITVECPAQLRVVLGYGIATFSGIIPDWNGEVLCVVRATDTGGLYAETGLPVVVRPVNDAPVIQHYLNVIHASDQPERIDVATNFFDADGDALSYHIDAPAWANITVNGSVLLIIPPEDVYILMFNLTAVDPHGLTSGPMPVMVQYLEPEGPFMTLSPTEYTVEEGSTIYLTNFTFYRSGPMVLEVTLSTEWGSWDYPLLLTSTGISWPSGQPSWTPEKLRTSRDVTLTVRVGADGDYYGGASVTVHVLRYNRPPVVQRVGPDASKAYHQGDDIIVFANAVDPDGDPLVFTWYYDDALLNITGDTLLINYATEGVHRVRVTASDGELNMTNNGSFAVLGSETTEGPWVTWAIVVVAVAIVVAVPGALYIRHRRKAPDQRSDGAS